MIYEFKNLKNINFKLPKKKKSIKMFARKNHYRLSKLKKSIKEGKVYKFQEIIKSFQSPQFKFYSNFFLNETSNNEIHNVLFDINHLNRFSKSYLKMRRKCYRNLMRILTKNIEIEEEAIKKQLIFFDNLEKYSQIRV